MATFTCKPQATYWEFTDASGRCRVHFIEKQEHCFVSDECQGFEILCSHPVLMDYEHSWSSVYVSSPLADPESIWVELKAAANNCTGSWRKPRHYFNQRFSGCEVLRGGLGMLADAPVPIAVQFAAILVKANISHHVLPSRPARQPSKALIAGQNFVVALDYKIERF